MTHIIREYSTINAANAEYSKKVNEKIRKGYFRIDMDQYGIVEALANISNAFSEYARRNGFEEYGSHSAGSIPQIINSLCTQDMMNTFLNNEDYCLLLSGGEKRALLEKTNDGAIVFYDENFVEITTPIIVNGITTKSVVLDGYISSDENGQPIFSTTDLVELDGSPMNFLPFMMRHLYIEKVINRASGIEIIEPLLTVAAKSEGISKAATDPEKFVLVKGIQDTYQPRSKIQKLDLTNIFN
jgi:hypothetical protein